MLLRRLVQPPGGLDILHDQQAGFGMDDAGHGYGVRTCEVVQHVALDVERAVGAGGLGDHPPPVGQLDPPDIADTSAGQRGGMGDRRACRQGDGLARGGGHRTRDSRSRSQAPAPSSIIS